VDLHEVDALAAQKPERRLHLAHALGASRGPDLGGEEGFAAPAVRGEQLARRRLGAAVHRRAVEDLAAGVEQRRDDAGQAPRIRRFPARWSKPM
jgi:hypothetical protein